MLPAVHLQAAPQPGGAPIAPSCLCQEQHVLNSRAHMHISPNSIIAPSVGKLSSGIGIFFQWEAHSGNKPVRKKTFHKPFPNSVLQEVLAKADAQLGPCYEGSPASLRPSTTPASSSRQRAAAQELLCRQLCRRTLHRLCLQLWPGSSCLKPIIIYVILTEEGTDLQSFFLVRRNHQPDLSCLAEILTQ